MQDRADPTEPPNAPQATPATLCQQVQNGLEAIWPSDEWRDVVVAVAVSGGADSVALLRMLDAAKHATGGRGELIVIHLDHGTRVDSADDADWVANLAQRLGHVFVGERIDPAGNQSAPAISEEALRNARRDFFVRAAGQTGARFVVTGHTADDQAETVLFHAFRGAGLRGLGGIRAFAPLCDSCTLARPLLGMTRQQITSYLAEIGQDYREDRSNAATDYTRNWLRHRVLPLAEERFPESRHHLARLATQATAAAEALEAVAGELFARATATCPPQGATSIRVDRTVLASRPELIIAEVFRFAWRTAGWPQQAMTAKHWKRLTQLATQSRPFAAEVFPGSIRVESQGEWMVLIGPEDTKSDSSTSGYP